MSDLVALENINAIEVFNGGEGLDDLLGKITEEAKSVLPDVTTKKGRDAIISTAAKVARSKTYLDKLRKDLVEDWTTKTKAVNSEGKKMRDTLDALRDEVRAPVTEYEENEKFRVGTHERHINEMTLGGEAVAIKWMDMPHEEMCDRLTDMESEDIESYEEFAPVAAGAKDRALTVIKESIAKREAYDKEQLELADLRERAAEQKRKDQEEDLRLEGEERAKIEAEAKAEKAKEQARLNSELAEQEKQNAINATIEAEKRAKLAEENAAKEADAAVSREQERVESERIAEEIAAKKREANKAHKSKINNAALDALVLSGLNNGQAKLAVKAIAQGKIPYTTISY